jgi:hypothetical protein
MPPCLTCGVGFFRIELGFFGLDQVLGQKSRQPVNYYGPYSPIALDGMDRARFFSGGSCEVAHDQV